MPGDVEFVDDARPADSGDELLDAGPRRRRWLALVAVVVAAGAALVVIRGADETPAPSPAPSSPAPSRVLRGDPRDTVDTSVVRASGSCDHPARCPLHRLSPQVREQVDAAVRTTFGAPSSLEIVTRDTGRGDFFSRVVTASTPAGRLLVVAAVEDRVSSIVVVHHGVDTVFARDYRGKAYINAVLTGPHVAQAVSRLRRLAADPRLHSTA